MYESLYFPVSVFHWIFPEILELSRCIHHILYSICVFEGLEMHYSFLLFVFEPREKKERRTNIIDRWKRRKVKNETSKMTTVVGPKRLGDCKLN